MMDDPIFEVNQSDLIKTYNLCKKANFPVFAKWVKTFYEKAFDDGIMYITGGSRDEELHIISYEDAVNLIGKKKTDTLIGGRYEDKKSTETENP
jgi:hypothetical protein